MPELPEVETIRRIIEPQIRGRVVKKVEVLNKQIIASPDAERFAEILLKQRFSSMDRRGKFLIFHFESGDKLFLHLRMTGHSCDILMRGALDGFGT